MLEKCWIIKHHVFLNILLFTTNYLHQISKFFKSSLIFIKNWASGSSLFFHQISSVQNYECLFNLKIKVEIGMVSTRFLHSPHLMGWPLQCLWIKSVLTAAFRRFGLPRVPTSCKCSSNGINPLMPRLIKFFLPSVVHTRTKHTVTIFD